MLAVIFVQKAVPQTDRQTHRHTQISKNRPPHVNFCFRRRTKLYGALRAPIRIVYIISTTTSTATTIYNQFIYHYQHKLF